ncbi:MAG: hypothetical protein V4450_07300 [Bacteroidota bacterium]
MTPEELEIRYQRMVKKVTSMRALQKKVKKFYNRQDYDKMLAAQSEVDKILIEEIEKQNSKQLEIL